MCWIVLYTLWYYIKEYLERSEVNICLYNWDFAILKNFSTRYNKQNILNLFSNIPFQTNYENFYIHFVINIKSKIGQEILIFYEIMLILQTSINLKTQNSKYLKKYSLLIAPSALLFNAKFCTAQSNTFQQIFNY